jgi:hypothetical protein
MMRRRREYDIAFGLREEAIRTIETTAERILEEQPGKDETACPIADTGACGSRIRPRTRRWSEGDSNRRSL